MDLCIPRFTPYVPGPLRELRLAAAGLLNSVEPISGRPKAAELNWNPLARPFIGFPSTVGRNEGPSKSPTASTAPEATLPGMTGSQSEQSQNGVNLVPVFANKLNDACHPPTRSSISLDEVEAKCSPRPKGRS